jgi:hypothetical protein
MKERKKDPFISGLIYGIGTGWMLAALLRYLLTALA